MIEIHNDNIDQKQWYKKQETNKIRDNIAYSMRQNMSIRNANNIWGKGFKFNSENEQLNKAFLKLDRLNRLNQLFFSAERFKSLYGRAIITINKTKTGEIQLNLANPWFYTQVGKVFVSEVLAVIWQKVITDSKEFFLKSIYTTEKVTNEWYSQEQGSDKMLLLEAETEIPEQYRVEKVWYHNLGFVPVLETFNRPYRSTYFNLYDYSELSDWYYSAFIEPVFVDTLLNFQKEINFTHSRVVIESPNQNVVKVLNQLAVNDRFDFGDYIFETELGAKTSFVAGVTDFTKYTQALNELMDLYYKFSCMSKFSEGGGAQKTSAETQQARSATIESIQQKITTNEFDYRMLIAKALSAMGELDYFADDWEFQFEIYGNIDRQDTVYLDNIIKQVNLGLMSAEEAIQSLRYVDKNSAKKIFEKIKDFNEENDIVTNMSGMADLEGDFQGSTPDGGRPTDTEENSSNE